MVFFYSRFSYRLLFLFIIAGSASFLIMMLTVESRQTVRSVDDDVLPMRHVASVADVGNVAANDAVADHGDANATKVIDPELREAMDRLGRNVKFNILLYEYLCRVGPVAGL